MNKTAILEYMRYRLDVIDSNISPAYEDSELYPFLDRAYLMVIDQQFQQGNLHLLKNLIDNQQIVSSDISTLTGSYQENSEGQVPIKVDISNLNFYIHIDSWTKLERNDAILSVSTAKWFPNVLIETENVSNVLITPVNHPYFLYPRVMVDHEGDFITIYPDYYMLFDETTDMVSLRYLTLPEKFETLDTPAVHESLHHNIADKAADLAKSPINAKEVAQEIQNEEQVKRSDS